MLLDKEVLVKRKNNSNLDYYKSIGYNIDSDYFLVKVEHLLKKSSVIVRVSCDFCNKNEEYVILMPDKSEIILKPFSNNQNLHKKKQNLSKEEYFQIYNAGRNAGLIEGTKLKMNLE